MQKYYSPSRAGFFDEAVHGPRTIIVVDEPKLAQLEAECLEEGEESDACALLSLDPPLVEVSNPDCTLPADAVPISDEEHAELLAASNDGKDISLVDGKLVTADRDVPIEQQLEALRRKRDRALAATDWTQIPDALTAAKRKLWADHRKALRDLPAMVQKAVKAGQPVDSVEFPEPPI